MVRESALDSCFSSPSTGTGNTVVVIMVGYPKGMEILEPVRRGIPVKMTIDVGNRHIQEYISGQSVVFVAIAFITMMIISLAWLIFFYIQRFLYTGTQFGNQVITSGDGDLSFAVSCKNLLPNDRQVLRTYLKGCVATLSSCFIYECCLTWSKFLNTSSYIAC